MRHLRHSLPEETMKGDSMNALINRREAIGLGAAAACAGACFAQRGATPAFAAEAAESMTWTHETDVVVVGFGGAGAAAAIEASRAGAQVVLLEMQDIAGGSTIANGGQIMMGGGTALQKKFGVEDTADNYFAYLCAACGASAQQDFLRIMADKGVELYDWCVGCGMDFESGSFYGDGHLSGYNTGVSLGYSGNEQSREARKYATPAQRGHLPQPSSSGVDIMLPLMATVEELGIEVIMGTPGKKLVTDQEGRVVGVVAGENDEYAIKANKGVVLTTGGFSNNEVMVGAHYPYPNPRPNYITSGGNENGSGILMAQAVGADTHGMSNFQIGTSLVTKAASLAKGILVNELGRRIVAEDEYNSFVGKALTMAPTPNCYLIMTESCAAESGVTDAPLMSGDTGVVADSVDELAATLGIDPVILAETVEFYNESVSLGEDREFGKAPEFLETLETPLRACKLGSQDCYLSSHGGLRVDTEMHVLDRDGNAIPGLYCAGRCAGTSCGWYVGSGSSMGDVLTFGRIAGQNAAAE